MPSPDKDIMTSEQVLAFLEHPFINFTGVAETFYGDGRPRAAQALRRRIYGVDAISHDTRQRLFAIAQPLVAIVCY